MARRQESNSARMVTKKNAKGEEERKLVWFDYEPADFGPEVAKLIAEARAFGKKSADAYAAATDKIKAKTLKTAEGEPLVLPGEELVVSFNFGKLTMASAEPRAKGGKNRGIIA